MYHFFLQEDGLLISQPKTKSSIRTISLPPPLLAILKEYKESVNSRWMFPSPKEEDSPMDPAVVRKRLSIVLKRADCKNLRFHDLWHTFATASLEHGMDVKTLSTIIGHVSSSTTLNIYAHVTDEMQRTAVAKKDRGIGKATPPSSMESASPAMSTPLPRRNMNKSGPPSSRR